MSYHNRLKRLNEYHVANEFKKKFPELKLSTLDIEKRLLDLDIEFYEDSKIRISLLMRFTVIFAIILVPFLFITMIFNYIANGRWGFRAEWIRNWFTMLGF